MLFFFFQAEDGIRDYKVTGVQTCALPIFCLRHHLRPRPLCLRRRRPRRLCRSRPRRLCPRRSRRRRSEERRVGKECRSRWWTYDRQKKQEIRINKEQDDRTDETTSQSTCG